jgi:WD40 repeat protein
MDRRLPVEKSNINSSSSSSSSSSSMTTTVAATTAQPWLVHSLAVNALNFCAFALCFVPAAEVSGQKPAEVDDASTDQTREKKKDPNDPVLLAVPNALNSGAIDIFHLPSEKRVSTVPADAAVQTGMVMAVNIFFSPSSSSDDDPHLYVVSGYEDGHVMVHVRRGALPPLSSDGRNNPSEPWTWQKVYSGRPHAQPVLSIDVPAGNKDYFITSSADALLAKHPVPRITPSYRSSSREEHPQAMTAPLKILNTKHAGQQGLRVRSDGKIFATAGWDARVRVYSCKTMKELAVLKWHKEGCYSVAFAEVVDEQQQPEQNDRGGGSLPSDSVGDDFSIATLPTGSLKAVQQQRIRKAQQTHWLAAGSKDGKISLWDIY